MTCTHLIDVGLQRQGVADFKCLIPRVPSGSGSASAFVFLCLLRKYQEHEKTKGFHKCFCCWLFLLRGNEGIQ